MILEATFCNADHPEYGVATIFFPIPQEEYDDCIEQLEAMRIGDEVRADCKVVSIDSYYSVLKRLEGLPVNVEELDYLAKRLDGFDDGEAAQFQAMAHKLELFEVKGLINLTFCCQQATVFTNFSDLDAVGKEHYMNLHGGSAPVAELENLDGEETARLLIDSGAGTVTPYGVVYDNGMKLEQVYDGTHFPCYYYEPNLMTLMLCERAVTADDAAAAWLFLPMTQMQLGRAILRAGIASEDREFRFQESRFPDELDAALQFETESIYDLNALCEACKEFDEADFAKLGAVCRMAMPENAREMRQLAENLEQFDFAPNVHTSTELGQYMIRESGHFDYDPELDAFYNYADYGTSKLLSEDGVFTDRGYISYHGTMTLDELMADDPAEAFRQEMQMSGL